MKNFLLLVIAWGVGLVWCEAQNTIVSGRVIRATNSEPLVGTSIFIKGTNRGTITDANGRYRLTISKPVTLVVRFVGFRDIEQNVTPQEGRLLLDFKMVSSEVQLSDLKVAANRVEEFLQRVPVSASVVSNRDLEARSIYNTMEALNNTPNLITDSWLSSQVTFSLRGLSTVFDNVGFESTVALYIDDVYFSRSFGFNSTLMDIERVEILRGPQGTLFGKNTIGGVIHVVSEKPEMTTNGQIELNYGNYNFLQARGKFNKELIKNKLAWRVTGALTKRDGYINDRVSAVEAQNKTNFYGFRSSLLYTPNTKTNISFRAHYGKDNNAENTFVYASKPDYEPLGIAADEKSETEQNLPAYFQRQQYGGVAKAEIELNSQNKLTLISSYNNSMDDYLGDNDVARADVSRWGRIQKLRNISQEVRINSPREQKFAYVGGLYFLNERIGALDTFTLNKDFIPIGEDLLGTKINAPNFDYEGYTTQGNIRSRSAAAFLSGTLELDTHWHLNGGLRFTSEKKTLQYYQKLRYHYENGSPIGLIDIYATNVGTEDNPVERTTRDNVLSFDVGLDYKVNPFTMGYAKFVRGFKGAGFNTSVITDSDGGGLVFKPEYVNSYELGIKSKFSDRVRLNAALFYTDYRNKQELLDQGTRVKVANANKTRGWGFETEFSGMLKKFRLDVSLGYLNFKYIDFPFGEDENGNPVNYAGNRLLKAPNFTFSFAPEYITSLGDKKKLFIGLNINQTGKAYNDISNSEIIARQSAAIVNSRIAIAPRDGKWSVALWGKNLTNRQFIQHGWEYDWGDQISWSRPRYWGVEVYLNFL